MTLELSEALIYVIHKMQISSGSLAQFSLCLSGFQCPLLSNHVTCPFHQTYPHSVIKGRLGIISFLNLAFRRISCSCSMFIFMAINSHAPSNQKQTGRPVLPLVALLQTVYSPHHPLTPPPSLKPLHNTTYKTHANAKANQLPQSPACPRLPSVHSREDAQRDPSPQSRLIKLRCATTFQKKKKNPLTLICSAETMR